MKTAMQQFVEHIEKNHSDILYKFPNLMISQDIFIEKEKQQITDAFLNGQSTVVNTPEQYYNDTFSS